MSHGSEATVANVAPIAPCLAWAGPSAGICAWTLDGLTASQTDVGTRQHGASQMTAQAPEHPSGYDLLRNPRLNKGTAFTEAERRARGLEGLLPPAVLTMALQVARRRAEIANLGDEMKKYLVLSDLNTRNETH